MPERGHHQHTTKIPNFSRSSGRLQKSTARGRHKGQNFTYLFWIKRGQDGDPTYARGGILGASTSLSHVYCCIFVAPFSRIDTSFDESWDVLFSRKRKKSQKIKSNFFPVLLNGLGHYAVRVSSHPPPHF